MNKKRKSILIWVLVIIFTLATAYYQRKTGPTHPKSGKVEIENEVIKYKLSRSHSGNDDEIITLNVPNKEIIGIYKYKRFNVDEEWIHVAHGILGDKNQTIYEFMGADNRYLTIADKVFKIQSFLEKCTSENPDLVDYKILAVKKADFAEVDINDSFFDSFRQDYTGFNRWFKSKFDNVCYICNSDNNLTAFLYIKAEDEKENYSDITPAFSKKKRLKIGTLKVINNGYKIGERFLKIVFDNAIRFKVDEIYVTIFDKSPEQSQLIEMLKDWGFIEHGMKKSEDGDEIVLVRPFSKNLPVSTENPKLSYPFFSRDTRKYIIKIEPQYHTELFPDSINTREDETKYTENEPHRNRIGKVYISHSQDRHLQSGDIIVIYRMGETKPKKYSSTVTSICIVEEVVTNFKSFDNFFQACVRRTMINKIDLENKWWNKFPKYRPFIIKFLYAHSFPTPKPTLNDLNQIGVIPDIMNMPRGFIEIDNNQFNNLINFAYKRK